MGLPAGLSFVHGLPRSSHHQLLVQEESEQSPLAVTCPPCFPLSLVVDVVLFVNRAGLCRVHTCRNSGMVS